MMYQCWFLRAAKNTLVIEDVNMRATGGGGIWELFVLSLQLFSIFLNDFKIRSGWVWFALSMQ